MISRRIHIGPKHDRYARLAAYIAGTGHDGEKCLMAWCVGCLGGEDYEEGINEMVDVQQCNTRAQGAKTYHLLISFRTEDEARLWAEVFKDIERRFAAALGYTGHQRQCGVHHNTANIHMHIAYNMINPNTYTLHKTYRDYWIRDQVCREVEREYGLHIDNGREQAKSVRLNDKAATMEAHSGQQSFQSYAKSHESELHAALAGVQSWEEAHAAFARFGLEIGRRANGLIFKDRHSRNVKRAVPPASDVAREFSLKSLESRFGPFVPPRAPERFTEQCHYDAAPLYRGPERAELFKEYQAGIQSRIARLKDIKDQEEAAVNAIRRKWTAKRAKLAALNISKRNRRNLISVARKREVEEVAKARLPYQVPRQEVHRDIPYASWSAFLQWKAVQGHEIALTILRSNKNKSKINQEECIPNMTELRAIYATRAREIVEDHRFYQKGKNRFLSVLRMEQILGEEKKKNPNNTLFSSFRFHIDTKGTLIFTLSSGGMIRDTGKYLYFTVSDRASREIAQRYARLKWGKNICLTENKIQRSSMQEKGLSRS